MVVYYLDTSALIKRYVQEQGTTWIANLTGYGTIHRIYTARLAGPEAIATFFRKARGGEITHARANQLTNNFRTDWQQQYRVLSISVSVTNRAMLLAQRYGLRGADALHLAAALELHYARQTQQTLLQLPPLTFVSADVEQLKAAQAEGLPVENPDNHT
ncbi:MAG TPA: type II toxin-antitoxin system VapC family toxin [Chloroflexia bacterium]|nr:type II toxin-antitoxin system VapC family toxin [Chloroflexia bacterium]